MRLLKYAIKQNTQYANHVDFGIRRVIERVCGVIKPRCGTGYLGIQAWFEIKGVC
jgi:hypothetical protein